MKLSRIDHHLQRVRKGLAVIRRRTDADFTDDDIIKDCREGRSFLFTVPKGFFILQPRHNEGSVSVDVVVAFGEGGGLIAEYQSCLVNACRMIGAQRITFNSPRKGFSRLPGWLPIAQQPDPTTTAYERLLTDG